MIVFSTCWQPQDTGFGDDSASIVNYRIESSICPSFSLEESCAYHNLLLQAGLETSYALNLTGEILPIAGRVYYIRVSAENEATRGASRLLMLPFKMIAKIISPAVTPESPLRVATGKDFVHVWASGSDLNFEGRLEVRLSGLDISNVSAELMAFIRFEEGQWMEQLDLAPEDTSDKMQTAVSMRLPGFSTKNFPCPTWTCPGRIEIKSPRFTTVLLVLHIEYFMYSDPEFVAVMPPGGPVSGGTRVKVRIRDFVGDETRQAAALPSFSDTLQQKTETSVSVQCNNGAQSSQVPVSSSLVKSAKVVTVETFQIFELSFDVPASPCDAGVVRFQFHLLRTSCDTSNCLWEPRIEDDYFFQYRMPGILEVTPSAGMINRGNDKIRVTIVLEGVEDIDDRDLNVTLAGKPCKLLGSPQKVQGAMQTHLWTLQAQMPQFSREMAGMMTLTVLSSRFGPFDREWEFLQPPYPAIASIRIDGQERFPLWLKQRSSSSQSSHPSVEVLITDLSSRYDFDFDELHVWVHDSRNYISMEASDQQGDDVTLTFNLDMRGLPAGQYNMTVGILRYNVMQLPPLSTTIYVRDMSVAAQIDGALAPTEGPIMGGTTVLLGVSGITKMSGQDLQVVLQLGDASPSPGEILGFVPVLQWETDDITYRNAMVKANNLRLGGMDLISEYERVVNFVKQSTEPADDGTTAAFLIMKMPAVSSRGIARGTVFSRNESLHFDFAYAAAPSVQSPVLFAITASGGARGGIEGGDTIRIRLSQFTITYDISKLSIRFGEVVGTVIELVQSDSQSTEFTAVVPPGNPGTKVVTVQNSDYPGNSASFEFEYVDDLSFEIIEIFPYQVYGDMINTISMVVLNFPTGITIAAVSIQMYDAASGDPLVEKFKPLMVAPLSTDGMSSTRTRVQFLSPKIDVEDHVLVKVELTALQKASSVNLRYNAAPVGPLQIDSVQPNIGDCTDAKQSVTMLLTNLRPLKSAKDLHIALGGKLVDENSISLTSTMEDTLVNFVAPQLPYNLTGEIQLSVWSKMEGMNTGATTTFYCRDNQKARLHYTQPGSGIAGKTLLVTLGISHFDANDVADVHLSSERYVFWSDLC